MTQVNPECFHQSASSTAAFKRCPTEFRLAYREGLRPDQDTDSQRQGTNWGAMHECYGNALARCGAIQAELEAANPGLEVKALSPEDKAAYALNEVVNLLNEKYANVPKWKTPEEWLLERTILLVSFVGYQWYYQNDPISYLASEVAFDLPIYVPEVNLPLPMTEVKRVGKLDHLIAWQQMVGVMERKSTSRTIALDSDYWDKSRKDTQVSMYAMALREMKLRDLIPDHFDLIHKIDDGTITFGNTLYDVWHKPTIKPKMLTQKDTATFITENVYMDQRFEVKALVNSNDFTQAVDVIVDGEKCEIEQGKKSFAIRETIGMYGARLLADIYERPTFYYIRREIVRTEADIVKARSDAYNVYQAEKLFTRAGCWFENEHSCRATFPCKYIPICYGPGADAVCDGKTTPTGFKRIFVDLTVNGVEVDE